jgi:uncharacterized protein
VDWEDDPTMMLNCADECRRRAEECRRNAAQEADDILRGTYLDLARRWRIMAHQAGSLEQKEATKKTSGFRIRLFAIALVVIAGSTAICGPASAQVYWGDRPSGGWGNHRSGGWGWDDWGDRHRQRDFFSPFFGDRYNRPAPAVDSSRAPPPRKPEKPPTSTVVVVGDSMADWLGYGLDELYSEQPETAVERQIRATSGLVRYDPKNETLEWPQAVKDALANEKPDAIIVMLGLNDRVTLRDKTPPPPNAKRAGEPAQAAKQTANQPAPQAPQDKTAMPADTEAPPQAAAQADTQRPVPGGSYEFHSDQWATLYAKRIDDMITALKSKGAPIVWVGLPAIRGTKATSDMSYLDELYRERAEKAGIVYVDIWDGFVDDEGRYTVQGPDFEGQVRRLRTADGVHFTKAGAVKLASYVDRELRRVISTQVAPVALPMPESAPKSGAAGARPDVGPVLPLSSGGGEHGDLLGAADHPSQMTSDPIAVKVLSRGDDLAAPAGRADDFSWPRPSAGASTAPENESQPTALSPAAPSKKFDEAKKPADVGKDNKNKPSKESGVSTRRRSTNLDGAPVPPAPVGSR